MFPFSRSVNPRVETPDLGTPYSCGDDEQILVIAKMESEKGIDNLAGDLGGP